MRSRKSIGKSGRKAAHIEIEVKVIAWCKEKAAAQVLRLAASWENVSFIFEEGNEHYCQAWRQVEGVVLYKNQLVFRREKRSLKLDKATWSERLASFHTFIQAIHRHHHFEVVGNFDEAFNGEFVKAVVLKDISFGSSSSDIQVLLVIPKGTCL